MNASLSTISYIGSTILFILSLGGLSNPETARRGNVFGMIGMALAVLATVFGPRVSANGYAWIIAALVVGGAVGLFAAKKVQMTLMPGRCWLNLAGLLLVIFFGRAFLHAESIQDGMGPLLVMTVIALLFGIHMVMAIGGADMPVVVSMLNSYSGWAAAATGFMLSN